MNTEILSASSARLRTLDIAPGEIREELQRILSSQHFCSAPRARTLLEYLVERLQAGALRDLTEYAIGLALFHRHPATYNTSDDPVVRVHIGRLRQKLRNYYAAEGRGSRVQLSLPLRTYVPEVKCRGEEPDRRLIFIPLSYLGQDADVDSFNQGLNEELNFRLHRMMGAGFAPGAGPCGLPQLAEQRTGKLLEGSLRADGQTLRVSLRLLDMGGKHIVWSGQVDNPRALTISDQARLAGACCRAFEHYLQPE